MFNLLYSHSLKFRGLYKGVQSPLAGLVFLNASIFTAFSFSKQMLSGEKNKTTIPNCFVAGSVAGIVSGIICTPMELFKCQLQVCFVYGS